MVKRRAGVIWVFSILGLALIGFIMMGHYGNAVVFGVIKGDADSQSSIENLFRFSNYPAKIQVFSEYDDLEKAFDRRLVDFVIYSYSREIDEQLHKSKLSFPNYPDLLEIGLDPFNLKQYLNLVQTESNVIQMEILFHRWIFDDYLNFLEKFKTSAYTIPPAQYQETFENYLSFMKLPQVQDYLISNQAVHADLAIRQMFKNKRWEGRLRPSGVLNEDFLKYKQKHKSFQISIDSVLRHRSYASPSEHPFMKLAEFASVRPKINCAKASKLVNFEVEGNTLSKKASELQEMLFEIIKKRHQSSLDAVSERLHSTIICY